MGIGALAERFGLGTHVLRYWEERGLLAPSRDAAGRRRYGEEHVTRVAVVLRAKEAGLSLDVIRALVSPTEPGRRGEVLRGEAEALRARVAAGRAALELVECAMGCEREDVTGCAHFVRAVAERTGADAAAPPGTGPRR